MIPPAVRRWAPVAVVYAVILTLSALPGDALEGTPGWSAVVGHASGYALLAASIHRAWDGRGRGLAAVVLAVGLGVMNEVQQGFVPGRSPDLADVGVDGLGALAGVLALGARRSRRLLGGSGR